MIDVVDVMTASATPLGTQAGGYSDHQRLDARSLAMHSQVAKKLLPNPALIDQARSTLARWSGQASDPVPSCVSEWGRILQASPEEIAGFLISKHEDATRLRQSSPFTNILTPEERSAIYAAFPVTGGTFTL